MFSRLTAGKHSLLARSSATVCECPNRKPVSPKRLRMILLRRSCSKSSGMILLQRASAGSQEENLPNRPNHLRIFSLEDKCACRIVCAKPLRMTSLQDSKNNRPGMILLQKKVGEGACAHFPCQITPGGAAAVDAGRCSLLRDLIAHYFWAEGHHAHARSKSKH